MAGFFLNLVDRDNSSHPHFRLKLEAVGYGFVIPVFFVSSGPRFDLRALLNSLTAFARVPLFPAGKAHPLTFLETALSVPPGCSWQWKGGRVRVTIDWHEAPRAPLRPLFELAEDSPSELDRYIELGRVLVALRGPLVLGHLQLVPTMEPGEIELKNMAVVPEQRGAGVGRALVETALLRCRGEGWSRMVIATAAADIGNLRFYQRLGFRLLSVERDAFTPASGYPDPIVIDGIPLLDRVWLSQDLPDI